MESLERCGQTWATGWGQHKCERDKDHEGVHRCPCDATLRRGYEDK